MEAPVAESKMKLGWMRWLSGWSSEGSSEGSSHRGEDGRTEVATVVLGTVDGWSGLAQVFNVLVL